jgi:solute carrier family 25 carnitine/acylcarnitine transporter 20/29
MSQAAATLYKEGGVGRFYKGFAPCLLRSVPANGTMLLVVDKVANYLHSQ